MLSFTINSTPTISKIFFLNEDNGHTILDCFTFNDEVRVVLRNGQHCAYVDETDYDVFKAYFMTILPATGKTLNMSEEFYNIADVTRRQEIIKKINKIKAEQSETEYRQVLQDLQLQSSLVTPPPGGYKN